MVQKDRKEVGLVLYPSLGVVSWNISVRNTQSPTRKRLSSDVNNINTFVIGVGNRTDACSGYKGTCESQSRYFFLPRGHYLNFTPKVKVSLFHGEEEAVLNR